MKNSIETSTHFSKHMGDVGINYGLSTLGYSFGELGEYGIFVRKVYGIGV